MQTIRHRAWHRCLALLGILMLQGGVFAPGMTAPASADTLHTGGKEPPKALTTSASRVVSAPQHASGRIIVKHGQGTDKATQREARFIQQEQLLEDFADSVNESLTLSMDVIVIDRACNEIIADAHYDPPSRTITVCQELVAEERALLAKAGYEGAELATRLGQSLMGTLLHELGHALIDVLALPFTGREEDVADQLTAFVLAQDPATSHFLVTIAMLYEQTAAQITRMDDLPFEDTHSLDAQRATNFYCYAYGSDPQTYAHLVEEGALDPVRSEGCEEELEALSQGWSALLAPHAKKPDTHPSRRT